MSVEQVIHIDFAKDLSIHTTNPKERRCNKFALYLLMPEKIFRHSLYRQVLKNKMNDFKSISNLSIKFGVDEERVKDMLFLLKLLSKSGNIKKVKVLVKSFLHIHYYSQLLWKGYLPYKQYPTDIKRCRCGAILRVYDNLFAESRDDVFPEIPIYQAITDCKNDYTNYL